MLLTAMNAWHIESEAVYARYSISSVKTLRLIADITEKLLAITGDGGNQKEKKGTIKDSYPECTHLELVPKDE